MSNRDPFHTVIFKQQPKDKKRVSANLDPDFSISDYIQEHQIKFDDAHSRRLRKHLLKKKLIVSFYELMSPIPVEDHTQITHCFHHVMNLLYPMVPIERVQEDD